MNYKNYLYIEYNMFLHCTHEFVFKTINKKSATNKVRVDTNQCYT